MSQKNEQSKIWRHAKPASNPPSAASMPEKRNDEDFQNRHASYLKRIADGPIGLLFLGDSITRRWEEYPDLWNRYFGNYQPANFGIGGDATQNLLWRIQNGELDNTSPRGVVLLIGTNNVPNSSAQEIVTAIGGILEIIRLKIPTARIILCALFPRGPQKRDRASVDQPYYMDVINAVNEQLPTLVEGMNIRFLDIGRLFLGSDGEIDPSYMPDLLHLVGAGFQVWGDSLKKVVEEVMNENGE